MYVYVPMLSVPLIPVHKYDTHSSVGVARQGHALSGSIQTSLLYDAYLLT